MLGRPVSQVSYDDGDFGSRYGRRRVDLAVQM